MRGAILIAAALTLGLSLSASAVITLPTGYSWGEQQSDTFANATNGVAIAGVVATGGGAWTDDSGGEWVGYDDGGNMALQVKNRTGGTGYRYGYFFGAADPLTTTGAADVNRQSFRAKYIGGTNTRADRGFLTNSNGGTPDAYGSDAGGGFAFYGSAAPAVTGIMGSGDFGITGSPAGSYANSHIDMIGAGLTTGWHQYDQLIYRNNVTLDDLTVIPAGTSEWYIDGNLVQTNTPAQTGEWVLGQDLAPPSRWMADFELWGPGRDATGTYSMLIDDVSVQ